MIKKTNPPFTLVLLLFLAFSLLLPFARAGNDDNSACDATSDCDTVQVFRQRVAAALDDDDAELRDHGLRGTLDQILTAAECQAAVDPLPPRLFVAGSGYTAAQVASAAPAKVAGLTLTDLATLLTAPQYTAFLEIRERAHQAVERALHLCPGTLRVHYTQVVQKSVGGQHGYVRAKHTLGRQKGKASIHGRTNALTCAHTLVRTLRFHADNCFVIFEETADGHVRATCDPTRQHPYETRIAASILFLNDFGYAGGDFYWANLTTAEPDVRVTPQAGRLVYFTAGPENLHGALPVEANENDDNNDNATPRRLTLAMWYVLQGDAQEHAPAHGQKAMEAHEDLANRQVLFELPMQSATMEALRNVLYLHLKWQENKPVEGSWLAHQSDDGVLHMIFKDNSAMFSIRLRETAIVVDRFVNGKHASLQYQLQESVVLHGILDEILALSDNNNSNKVSVLQLADKGASIQQARETLPARRA